MTNAQISEQLDYIASLLEYLEGESFPARRFTEMARAVERFDFPVSLFSRHHEIHKMRVLFFPKARDEQLDVLRELILEKDPPADEAYQRQTRLSYHSQIQLVAALEKEVPLETAALIRIPEMGAARAAALRDALGVKNSGDLTRQCQSHAVRKLEGFDAELEKKWLFGKWYSSEERAGAFAPIQWVRSESVVDYILEQLEPLTRETAPFWAPTPWEEFRQDPRPQGAPPAEPFGGYPPAAEPGAFPARPDRWNAPVRPIPNVRLRRSLSERVRAFFSKPKPSDLSNLPQPRPRGDMLRGARSGMPTTLLEKTEVAGDFRRLNEGVRSFDFLLVTRFPDQVSERIAALPFLRVTRESGNVIEAAIDRKKLTIAEKYAFPGGEARFFLCSPHSRVAASVCRSSSQPHWSELIARAEKAGFFLDETGLYREKKEVPLEKEGDLYEKLGLPDLPPEIRDSLFEFRQPPASPELLISRSRIRGDLHMHSTFSDGRGTIEQMADKAVESGYEYIALTDHTKRSYGLDEEGVLECWRAGDRVTRRIREIGLPLTILRGIEVDVLEDARLDLSEEILAQADWVMASLHYGRGQSREMIHRRMETALTCPYVSGISHPTGKEWQSSFRLDMDLDYIFDLAAKHGKCLEMNCKLHRFDLDWRLCRRAKEHGIKIVISTDSHSPQEMDNLRYGVQFARKAGLTPDDVVNTLPLSELMAMRKRQLQNPAPLSD